MIFPDAMLGMLGGGQLGRMFTLAAHSMGYRVTVLDPDPLSPAGAIADVHLKAAYQDREALQQLADTCAAVTTEFENVPAESLRWLASHCTVRPAGDAVAVAQDRIREKAFVKSCGIAVAPYAVVESEADVAKTGSALFPAILKRARFGYDGKGQARVANADEARKAFVELGSESCVLEQRIALKCELSAVVARGADGIGRAFPVAENRHRNGILDVCIVPARVTPELAQRAEQWALTIAEKLNYCGVLAVEFFVSEAGELLVNEMAPRPHNSGHYTMDACATSQFEQQVRTLCGLPLGAPKLLSPVVMVNLLGEAWQHGQPLWERVFNVPEAKLHLYGKHEARAGRKMGHYTVLGESADTALQKAVIVRSALYPDWND
ncbi:MAG: 5-(carboxyamino)imidazole ribonucleotide synthase [Betaproteobacteria bacterium]|jgi:5-(carboxyamino)imidazole ribonucleotide synthase|nr:5-(carboxyamino)imidazole ribonucleotide synthase [Betaproteobacteria bacterium]MDH4293284.1 5-(carboxyamino)imidazole ribonucleotide synthase [Betaproteobacteria bacterium]MDH5342355.1 5-(carboxyamino)imidazole ribonucleotide synthase [Betaproteobacteria bacterium]